MAPIHFIHYYLPQSLTKELFTINEKLTRGLTIPPVWSSLTCKKFLMCMLYTDVYCYLSVLFFMSMYFNTVPLIDTLYTCVYVSL